MILRHGLIVLLLANCRSSTNRCGKCISCDWSNSGDSDGGVAIGIASKIILQILLRLAVRHLLKVALFSLGLKLFYCYQCKRIHSFGSRVEQSNGIAIGNASQKLMLSQLVQNQIQIPMQNRSNDWWHKIWFICWCCTGDQVSLGSAGAERQLKNLVILVLQVPMVLMVANFTCGIG